MQLGFELEWVQSPYYPDHLREPSVLDPLWKGNSSSLSYKAPVFTRSILDSVYLT